MKDHETDLRLKRTYGVGLGWYNEQFALQNGGCWICGNPPGTRRLNIDHDHGWVKAKIRTYKVSGKWTAVSDYRGDETAASGFDKKGEAIRVCKDLLKKLSVRGLLCHKCNRGLEQFRDNPELLRRAAEYLLDFRSGVD